MGKIVSRIKESPGTSFVIALLLVLVAILYVQPAIVAVNTPAEPEPPETPTDSGNFTYTGPIKFVKAGDASDIQAQIDACPRSGCTIWISPGTYVVTDTIVINNSHSNIRLVGSGSGHFNSGGAPKLVHATDGRNVINITGSGISALMVDNVLIENIYFESDHTKRGYAIYARFTSEYGVKLLNNFFYGFYDSAIAMRVTWGLLVDHNTFWGCGNDIDDSSAIQYLNPSPYQNTFAQIVNNLIEVSYYGAIDTTHSTSSYIAGNWLEGGDNGIIVGSGSRVTGNYLYGVREIGIYSGYEGTVIEGNQIEMTRSSGTSMGIKVWGGAVIKDNVVNGGAYGGIWAYGDQSTISGNLVSRAGINSSITGGIVVADGKLNIVSNNVIRDGGMERSSGIMIRSKCSHNVVMGNTIDNVYNGIHEEVSVGYGHNMIIGNIITQSANVAIYSNGAGTEISHNITDGL